MGGASRAAIITGAGNGLGRAMAQRVASLNVELVLVDFDGEALRETEKICGHLCPVTVFEADVRDEPRMDAIFDSIDARLGRLDILVNNAALIADTPIGATGIEVWRNLLDTNLTAPFFWSQRAAQLMKRERFGRIINISSHAAHMGTTGRSAYAASKAGLEALTRTMAVELAPNGITVNAIAPGAIETERSRSGHSAQRRCAWEKAIPMKRYGTPENVSEIVALLCSEKAGYVTGETIRVDGGFCVSGLMLDR